MRIVKCIVGILFAFTLFLIICSSIDLKLGNGEPITDNVETQLVEATIDAEYNEGLCNTTFSVRYGNTFSKVSFTGFEGFVARLRNPGDKIAMYLNTMKDEDGRIVSQWLNMGSVKEDIND